MNELFCQDKSPHRNPFKIKPHFVAMNSYFNQAQPPPQLPPPPLPYNLVNFQTKHMHGMHVWWTASGGAQTETESVELHHNVQVAYLDKPVRKIHKLGCSFSSLSGKRLCLWSTRRWWRSVKSSGMEEDWVWNWSFNCLLKQGSQESPSFGIQPVKLNPSSNLF